MEVHHHPHVHGKKKFSEYFLEFFMLFLAVTLGFLAENFREHITEKKREKEYIESLVGDVKNDTADIGSISKMLLKVSRGNDSLITLMRHYQDNDSINRRAYHHYSATAANIIFVTFNDNTLRQLLNTGSTRLITMPHMMDSIMLYNGLTRRVDEQRIYFQTAFDHAFNLSSEIFNLSTNQISIDDSFHLHRLPKSDTVKFRLLSTDPAILSKYAALLTIEENLMLGYILQLQAAKRTATRLISLLKKEYSLHD